MYLFRAYIENKKVINRTYWSNPDDTEIVKLKNLKELNKEKDLAIILIHGKFFTNEYHWLVYPVDNIKDFFGENTVIDLIYLIRKK